MIKPIVRDLFFLGQKSEKATKQDLQIGMDLQDTLNANRDRCVGMAANMIGVNKRIIIVNVVFMDIVMYNPVIFGCRMEEPSGEVFRMDRTDNSARVRSS